MKTERNILIVFILNLLFTVFEFLGGIFTGSVAIVSDAIHDLGDTASVGISYFMEKKSRKKPDEICTYGYVRYSVIGGYLTTLVLLAGSILTIFNACKRIITPSDINYDGVIIFAVAGFFVNLCAVFVTRNGVGVNQKAVNLHMLEDVLGWGVVLVGAVVMRYTNFVRIDPIISILVSIFIAINAFKNFNELNDIFLEKTPHNIQLMTIKEAIGKIDGVLDVHHIHIWSLDGNENLATVHVVSDCESSKLKNAIRNELRMHRISHVTIEIETSAEQCSEKCCCIGSDVSANRKHCRHHGHHSHC